MYSNDLICDVLEYIDTFLCTKITIQNLENKFFYNRYYIMKLFKKVIGITIFDYINKLRIDKSITEMNTTDELLIKVALKSGFYSLEYFSEIFKKEIGISPRQYKKIISNQYYYDEKYEKAISNILSIKKIIDLANRYKENRKRTVKPVRKISIFD